MKDPIKIIHKFKNNNRRIQYKVYIFVGTLVPKNIMKILEIIENKDFYTTLDSISKNDYNEMETYYGPLWYEKFFISYHINSMRHLINNTSTKKKSLETKYGKEWYEKNIINSNIRKLSYSFASEYYNNLLFRNKIKTQTRKVEMDFRTVLNKTVIESELTDSGSDTELIHTRRINSNVKSDNVKSDHIMFGGGDDNPESTDNESVDNDDDDEDVVVVSEEEFDEHVEDNLDLEEITKLYSTVDIENEKTIKETSKLISEAINDKKWDKQVVVEQKYDDSMDSLSYDTKLEDVYNKYYITDQYIFKDDTIKSMRNKITTSIACSNKISKDMKLLPDCQYFWSEYMFNKEMDNVMIGQKWIRRNELLKIDIIPNENIKIYEKLRNNLGYLKDSFGYKIKREDDETNIIRSYDDFMTMNEIFMLDVYNDLGLGYNPEPDEKRNLYDVYINIYFPMITFERLEQIIMLLSGKNDKEIQYIDTMFGTIRNDIKLESMIEESVEKAKLELGKFDKYFSQNHIIQSIIHVNIIDPKNITGTTVDTKFNLYRIFDNFIVDMKYPFIQYQTPDSQLSYKFYSAFEDKEENSHTILSKWFENAPYGISFKIKIDDKLETTEDKYISINLHETGRIEYKITWKESDMATVENINRTYDYVRDLLKKINSENKKIKFILPENDRFKYAFINTIQKFTIPEKFKIDHNDLSEFSRYFFPYISLVIEPKKRVSKKQEIVEETSKFGTYLRYKRISKYENRTKMHLRILYFLRNYDLNDRELIDEIAKQFNITPDVSAKELDYVREKYIKVIKKSKKLLKKLKSMPKSKPPGIGIDIQGRDRDKYKIRITGARNKDQLDEIISFMKVLIYLYVETYLYKNKDFQKLKDTLKNLNKIARRRNKVVEIVEYDESITTVKTITNLDKARLGFKPEKGQNQWTRSCQNSGTDKKRRPEITPGDMMDKLLKDGYKMNQKTGFLEKEIEMKIKGKTQKTIIKAVKLSGENSVNYYTCDPSDGQEHKYIGFLARGNNPSDLCMPCCFKKDQLTSGNKVKKNYFMKCLGDNTKEETQEKSLGDKLYILQETNKVQTDRYIYLPKYLDIFFNKIWNHDHVIKNHYLLESKSGYFFKYTLKHDHYNLLVVLSNIYQKTIEEIIGLFVTFINKDKDNTYFNYLNNGDISEIFKTREAYIEYIKTSKNLEYDMIGELSSIPGVISNKGINFYILNKETTTSKKALEKIQTTDKYYLDCLNPENYYQLDEDKDIIILIKEDKYYFPIYKVFTGTKSAKTNKKISLQKTYSIKGDEIKIIEELRNYHTKSCMNLIVNNITSNINLVAKNIITKLESDKNIKIKKQYIDDRHKCKYLELNNDIFLPVIPSGISYMYPFSTIRNIKNIGIKLDVTIKLLDRIEKILKLNYIPKSVIYDKKSGSNIRITSIRLVNNLIIPIKNDEVTEMSIKKLALSIEFQALEETINMEIINHMENEYDMRSKSVKEHNYKNESYNLYRLELSLYLSNNEKLKDTIIKIVRGSMDKDDKRHELRKILFKIINYKLKGDNDSFVFLTKKLPNLKDYIVSNIRDYCMINKTQDKCDANLHCSWVKNSCKLNILEDIAADFVNKVIEEMIQDNIKFKEIIQESSYYVSDIVDYTQFTNRNGQKIIKASNMNIQKLMAELFGKDKVPVVGKRQTNKTFMRLNDDNEIIPELIELGKQYVQEIIPNKDSIIRAYVNSYYWINNMLYDTESRNLGYNSMLQSEMTNLFKANIIDWIQTNFVNNKASGDNAKYLKKYLKEDDNFFESTLNKFRKSSYNTDGKMELYILSLIIPVPIVVYDNYSNVKYIFLQGEIEVTPETIKNFTQEKNLNKTIFLKFDYDNSSTIPKNIYSIYYH
jgi:hypothetical protein